MNEKFNPFIIISREKRARLEIVSLAELVDWPAREIGRELARRKPRYVGPNDSEHKYRPDVYLDPDGYILAAALKYLMINNYVNATLLHWYGLYTNPLRELYLELQRTQTNSPSLTDPVAIAKCLNEFIDANQNPKTFVDIVARELKFSPKEKKKCRDRIKGRYQHWMHFDRSES